MRPIAHSEADRPRTGRGRQRALRVVLFVLIVAVFVVGGTYFVQRLEQAAPVVRESTVWLGTVERGEMIRAVRANGTLTPRNVHWVPAPAEGRIGRVAVKAGATVMADDVLIEVHNPVTTQAVQDAEWQLEAAEAELRNLVVQLDTQYLDRSDASAILQAELKVSELQNMRNQQLYESGLLAKHDLDVTSGKVEELRTRATIATNYLTKAEESREAQLAAQKAKVEQLKAQLTLRREQADALIVRAGIDGVVQQVYVEEGQQISPSTNLAKVVRPDELRATVLVSEAQMRDVSVGLPVSIDTRNGVVAGRVERIDPAVKNGTVDVDVVLDGALPASARPDLSVEGTIELERLADVLHVGRPVAAVSGGTMSLFRVDADGSAIRVPVRLGRASVNEIEVLEGLHEGDRVILSDVSKWELIDRLELE